MPRYARWLSTADVDLLPVAVAGDRLARHQLHNEVGERSESACPKAIGKAGHAALWNELPPFFGPRIR